MWEMVVSERKRRRKKEGYGKSRDPRVGSHPTSKVLKNTLIAELI